MARLRSREKFPPGQFQILLPVVGMKKPVAGSFSEVVTAFAKIVEANPALAEKHGWPRDREGQENWIDAREAQRMLANGWTGFVDPEGENPKARPARKGGLLVRAGNVAAKASTAAAIYRDLLGPDGKAVPQAQAEARAAVCVGCPANDKTSSLTKFFVESTAKTLIAVFGILRDRKLVTSLDDQLGTCEACDCPLKAKVWPDISHIRAHQKEDAWERIRKANPECWQTKELEVAGS